MPQQSLPAAVALLSLALTAANQAAAPAFEVASVKPDKSGDGTSRTQSAHGEVRILNLSLRRLIEKAYDLGEYQLVGPQWLGLERYDVIAKAPVETPGERINAMMRTLLAERFQLVSHRESRTLAVYALGISKGGPKLRRAEPGIASTSRTNTAIAGKKLSMSWLSDALSQRLDRPVVDATGLEGVYDLELKWSPDEGAGPAPKATADAGSIFTAIQEQLGLKLEARKMPVDVLVIDRAEKVPLAN
jgi:uncharacterized protein (TIGR03435 family)